MGHIIIQTKTITMKKYLYFIENSYEYKFGEVNVKSIQAILKTEFGKTISDDMAWKIFNRL